MFDWGSVLTGGAVVAAVVSFIGQRMTARAGAKLQQDLETFKAEAGKNLEDQKLANQKRFAKFDKKLTDDLKVQEQRYAKDLIDHQAPYEARLETLKNELTKIREIQKAELDKQQFVHRLQFEKEFSVYVDLWKSLTRLQTASMFVTHSGSDQAPFLDALKAAANLIQEHRPFYDDAVYHAALAIVRFSQEKTATARRNLESTSDWIANISKMSGLIEGVCAAIRGRIGLVTASPRLD